MSRRGPWRSRRGQGRTRGGPGRSRRGQRGQKRPGTVGQKRARETEKGAREVKEGAREVEAGQEGQDGGQGGQEGPGVLTDVSLLTARLLTPWDATGTRRQQIDVLISGELLQISKIPITTYVLITSLVNASNF